MTNVANISRQRTVAAAADAVWEVLADFGALSSWVDEADHSSLLHSGPDGAAVGSARRVQMGRFTLVERITECEPPATLAYTIEGLPKRLGQIRNRWTLYALVGGTEVTITSSVDMGSALARPAELVVARVMARQSQSMLAGLARRLEKPHA